MKVQHHQGGDNDGNIAGLQFKMQESFWAVRPAIQGCCLMTCSGLGQ